VNAKLGVEILRKINYGIYNSITHHRNITIISFNLMSTTLIETSFLSHWTVLREQALAQKIPVISLKNAVFLQSLLKQYRPQNVLEIGSAIGISGAWIAQTIAAWGGQLDTLEISVPTHAAAVCNFERLGITNVRAHCNNALAGLNNIQLFNSPLSTISKFDCIFIDAHKKQTQHFYTACLPYLNVGGLIIVDDAWKFRHKMQVFYQLLEHQKQVYSLHFVDDEDATLLIHVR
jgi:predicted O-methyltransferase YrrM